MPTRVGTGEIRSPGSRGRPRTTGRSARHREHHVPGASLLAAAPRECADQAQVVRVGESSGVTMRADRPDSGVGLVEGELRHWSDQADGALGEGRTAGEARRRCGPAFLLGGLPGAAPDPPTTSSTSQSTRSWAAAGCRHGPVGRWRTWWNTAVQTHETPGLLGVVAVVQPRSRTPASGISRPGRPAGSRGVRAGRPGAWVGGHSRSSSTGRNTGVRVGVGIAGPPRRCGHPPRSSPASKDSSPLTRPRASRRLLQVPLSGKCEPVLAAPRDSSGQEEGAPGDPSCRSARAPSDRAGCHRASSTMSPGRCKYSEKMRPGGAVSEGSWPRMWWRPSPQMCRSGWCGEHRRAPRPTSSTSSTCHAGRGAGSSAVPAGRGRCGVSEQRRTPPGPSSIAELEAEAC